MTSYKLTGSHAVNAFTQAKLVEAGFLNMADYKVLTPIIPAQQQPEFTNLPKGIPFIVYNYAQEGTYQDWWLEHEQLAYVVYTDDANKIRDIIHYLTQLYRRFDWSADELNDWLLGSDWKDGGAGTPNQRAFEFKYIRVVNSTSIEPATEEGGRHSAMIVLHVCFTSDLDGEPELGTRHNKLGMRA
ncbi:hypothetical protein KNU49_gp212 [Streptomyces phage EGole]|uniref:Tail terminator n=1 Tax=Streptomyces phage EGole TaxID=2517973 RepID=A0A482JH18_9CAUD|nr:hypothetical protein KNU49_gp212 [Streptomyces phage EGole]QBP30852.1 hypothetical protein SEA_EGOLE_56 [Streptomyces phage EGole]